MAAKVYRLGDRAGNGSKVKIINQLLAGVHIAAAAEAMALGLREGVDAAALYEVITHSAGNSWMFENRMAHVLAGDYTPLSAVDIFVKDLGLVLDTARATKFPLPLASTAHQMFMQASTAGFAKEDDCGGDQDLPRHRAAGHANDDPPRLHRRRLHRRDRPRQQPGARRHARGADDRRPERDAAASRRRRRRRRAQVAHHRRRPTRWRSRSRRAAGCRRSGATQIYFKVCSTFDSTPRGNIGPVLEALMDELGCALHDRRRRPSPTTGARSSRATCSSATCCSPRAACATIR